MSGASRAYRIVPSLSTPKLVVPAKPRTVSAAALRNFKTVSTLRTRITIDALAWAVRLGVSDLVLPRVEIADEGVAPADDIEVYLSTALERPVSVSVHISPPRAVRKPVLQVLGEAGETLGFAKIGVDDFTRTLVRAEAAAVSFLSSVRWATLRVPSVLHEGSWRGHAILVQSALPRGRNVSRPEQPTAAMRELARVRGVRTTPLGESSYWRRLLGRLHRLPESSLRAVVQNFLQGLEGSNGTSVLGFGAWHGDWAPWNMVVADHEVRVWDWEKFESDVPLGFDAVHYDVQAAAAMGPTPPATAFRRTIQRAGELLQPHGVAGESAMLVVALYLAHIAIRYLEDGEPEAGDTPMSRLSSWLDDVLRDAAWQLHTEAKLRI